MSYIYIYIYKKYYQKNKSSFFLTEVNTAWLLDIPATSLNKLGGSEISSTTQNLSNVLGIKYSLSLHGGIFVF